MNQFKYKSYSQYICEQKSHEHTKYRTKDAQIDRIKEVEIIKAFFPNAKKMLCIGCRSYSEVQDFEKNGFEVTGIDLFQDDPRIIICDMHKMLDIFEKESFDIVYLSHSLEHSYNPYKVIDDLYEIVKYGMFVVLPELGIPSKKDPTVFDFMKKTDRNIADINKEINLYEQKFDVIEYQKRKSTRGQDFYFVANKICSEV